MGKILRRELRDKTRAHVPAPPTAWRGLCPMSTATAPARGRIGIMSALPQELAAVLALMPDEHRTTVAGRDFWPGHGRPRGGGRGIGHWQGWPPPRSHALLLQRFGVEGIVFTGVAGGLGDGVRVGDAVVATRAVAARHGCLTAVSRHEMPGYGLSRFVPDAHWQQGCQPPPGAPWPAWMHC